MIRIKFLRHSGCVHGIECSGHAGYAEEGHDIVCSAVSALTIALANGITEIAGIPADVSDDGKIFRCRIREGLDAAKLHDAGILFGTFECAVRAIREEYPDYLKIYDTEV